MSIKIDRVQLNVEINGSAARTELQKQRQAVVTLSQEMIKYQNAINRAKTPEKVAELTEKFHKTREELEKAQNVYQQNLDKIDMNNMSLKELTIHQKELNQYVSKLEPKSESFSKYSRQLKEVNSRVGELKKTISAPVAESGFFSKWSGFAVGASATINLLSQAKNQIYGMADDIAAMDDVYSDVQKTTGLTRDAILDLNKSFDSFDTRTSRKRLNELAAEAGKLGYTSKQDILEFVDAANQIQVALGEDLGDDAIKNIGKMADLYSRSTKELNSLDLKGRLLSIGSALNAIGASSSASEGYIVDFTARLGGIATQADLSAQKIMGFASVLDQDMQSVEVAATSLSKFIQKMYTEPQAMAKAAGVDVKAFTEMLKTDTNEAIFMILEGLNAKGGFEGISQALEKMSLTGNGVSSVIADLAGNIENARKAQEVATESFAKGTSITDEYNIKNFNLAAKVEKSKNAFNDASVAMKERMYPALLQVIDATTSIANGLRNMGVFVIDNWRWWGWFVASLLAYGTTIASITAATKIWTAVTTLATVAQVLLSQGLAAARTKAIKLNAAILANPWGIIIGAIVAVGAAIASFCTAAKESTETMKAMDDIQKKVNESTSDQISKVDTLKKIIHDMNQKDSIRLNAIAELKKIVPEYTAELSKEGDVIKENTRAVDDYVTSLKRKARAEAVYDKIKDLNTEIINNDIEINKLGKQQIQSSAARNTTYSNAGAFIPTPIANSGGSYDTVIRLENQNKEKQEAIDKLGTDNADVLTNSDPVTIPVVLDFQYKNDKKYKKEADKIKNDLQSSINSITEEYKKGVITSGQGLEKLNEAQEKYNNSLNTLNTKSTKKGNNNGTSDESGSSDPYANALKEIDRAEEQKKLILQKSYQEGTLAEQAYNEQRIQAEIDANKERMNLANDFIAKKNDKMQEYQLAYVKAEVAANAGLEKLDEEHYKKLLKNKEALLSTVDKQDATSKESLTTKVESGDITQADYNSAIIAVDLATAATRKEIQQNVINELQQMEWESAIAKESILRKEGDNLTTLETVHLKARAKANSDFHKKVQSNEKAAKEFLKKYSGKGNDVDLKIEQLDTAYNLIDKTKLSQEQLLLLEKTYQDARNEIIREAEDEADAIRQKHGKNKIEQQYKSELKDLKKSLDKGLITQKEHESAVFDAKVEKAKAYYDIVASGMGNLVSSLKDAAISQIEAEYDAKINATEEGSEEQQRLEEEKQEKIKEVHKKYADIEFAMKVSEIIANSAVAIMAAWKLGPVMGGIMTPIIAATGLMQIATANAEREKVKGYKKGGYTYPGANDDEVVGDVHANEFVGTAAAVRNPAINRIFNIINTAQQTGRVNMINTTDLFQKEQAKMLQVLPIQTVTNVISQRSEDAKTLKSMQSTIQQLSNILSAGIYAKTEVSIAGVNGIARKTARYNALRDRARRPYK